MGVISVSRHPDEPGRPATSGEFVNTGVSRSASGTKPDSPVEDRMKAVADILALAEQAEEEAAEAEAVAAAARARARAIQLRRRAQLADDTRAVDEATKVDEVLVDGQAEDNPDKTLRQSGAESLETEEGTNGAVVENSDEKEAKVASEAPAKLRVWYRRRLRRPSRSAIGVGLSVLVIVGSLTGSGYIVWEHRDASQQRQQAAEFATAAREGVVTLTSLDFNKAQEDVQRIIDNSVGAFKDDFESKSGDFIKVVQDSKVVTKGTVRGTAVESMSTDSAVVLVAATSEVTNAAGAKQEPRSWRLSVTVTRDGGQIKLSKVEFVP